MNKEPFNLEYNTLNRVFQIALRVEGNHTPLGEIGNFAGGFFLLGGGKLSRSDFDHLNLSQS